MTNYDNFEHGYKGIMDVRLTDLYPIIQPRFDAYRMSMKC